MTRDDIIRIAREAGFEALLPSEHVDQTGGVYVGDEEIVEILERFAAIVAAAEREACAEVAEKMLRFYTQAVTGVPEAIRARGKE